MWLNHVIAASIEADGFVVRVQPFQGSGFLICKRQGGCSKEFFFSKLDQPRRREVCSLSREGVASTLWLPQACVRDIGQNSVLLSTVDSRAHGPQLFSAKQDFEKLWGRGTGEQPTSLPAACAQFESCSTAAYKLQPYELQHRSLTNSRS